MANLHPCSLDLDATGSNVSGVQGLLFGVVFCSSHTFPYYQYANNLLVGVSTYVPGCAVASMQSWSCPQSSLLPDSGPFFKMASNSILKCGT